MIKEIGKNLFRRFGLEVSFTSLEKNFSRNVAWHCQDKEIDICFDIGANRGQFAMELRAGGYTRDIVSFEPIAGVHAELLRTASKDAKWKIAPRIALGERSGQIEINVAENSASSSVLPMLSDHLNAAPQSRYVGRESVRMTTVDEFAKETGFDNYERIFLKIDTQGFEAPVLAGATDVLEKTSLVLLEMSLRPLYENSCSFLELYQMMTVRGFRCINVHPFFFDAKKHELLQLDGLFSRTL